MKRLMKNKKGFTMAELLIVVAIIAVLVAIAIPVFTSQLDKAKVATEVANGRSAYADYAASQLGDGSTVDYDGTTSAVSGAHKDSSVNIGSTPSGTDPIVFTYTKGSASESFSVDL